MGFVATKEVKMVVMEKMQSFMMAKSKKRREVGDVEDCGEGSIQSGMALLIQISMEVTPTTQIPTERNRILRSPKKNTRYSAWARNTGCIRCNHRLATRVPFLLDPNSTRVLIHRELANPSWSQNRPNCGE